MFQVTHVLEGHAALTLRSRLRCILTTKQEQEKVIKNTRSGGVTINDAMFHLMQSQLPFGGVGPSGYGCYHGREGFMNFSNMRSIYYQTNNDSVFGMLRPPKNKSIGKLQNILKKLS